MIYSVSVFILADTHGTPYPWNFEAESITFEANGQIRIRKQNGEVTLSVKEIESISVSSKDCGK
jgi:hypothetical protein